MIKPGVLRVLGTMSGTSLDGVDAAVIFTDGREIAGLGESAYRPYTADERAVLHRALGAWQGEARAAAAAEVVERATAELLARFSAVDLVGFHGQTLAHDPGGMGTHQAGSGQVLAQVTGWPVVWDFRSADVAMGGQGAPLVPFFHHALMRHAGLRGPVAVLNLGGVANVTWCDPGIAQPEAACLAFDCGPGNAAMDDLARSLGLGTCDRDGHLAGQGAPDLRRLGDFAAHRFFARVPPKSLDRAAPQPDIAGLSDADAMATLAGAVALGVSMAFDHFPTPVSRLFVAGGGRHNPVLMRMIAASLGCPVDPVETLGFEGDMIEAQAFGWLAVRVARGLPTSGPRTTGVAAPVAGGQISLPDHDTA
jgi:anhydro-N-acetylmuramic acid kinase